MTDKNLVCRDCGTSLVFTESEQSFFAQKGFTNAPSRCSSCREARKTERGDSPSSGRGSYQSYGTREREMHPAVCAQCGKETTVPFVPREDRPVYCSDCYSKQRSYTSSGSSGSGGRRSY